MLYRPTPSGKCALSPDAPLGARQIVIWLDRHAIVTPLVCAQEAPSGGANHGVIPVEPAVVPIPVATPQL